LPSTGRVLFYSEPAGPGIRVDSGIREGSEITIDYDPIMAKLIVHAPDRDLAIAKMITALHNYKILGVKTSKRFMVDVLTHPEFIAGRTFTSFIERHMSTRQTDIARFRNLAVAAASAESTVMTRSNGTGVGRAEAPTPWLTIGSWEIGDSIHA
ncbi:pyruvate carboxylase subunit A, partial [candidate division GN15 bacterium]